MKTIEKNIKSKNLKYNEIHLLNHCIFCSNVIKKVILKNRESILYHIIALKKYFISTLLV